MNNKELNYRRPLKLISELVKKPHIHFCVIYTSEPNKNQIIENLLSYFSGKTKEYYDNLKFELAEFEVIILKLLDRIVPLIINQYNSTSDKLFDDLYINENISLIDSLAGDKDKKTSIIEAGIAFTNSIKSESVNSEVSLCSQKDSLLVINNTILSIINKNDINPENLIKTFSSQIIDSEYSFTKLLGLEMQNIFARKGAFIDSNLLQISKEAFLFHRKQKGDDDFDAFVKEILFGQVKLNIKDEKLSLLNNELLNSLGNVDDYNNDDEILLMNVFYNSSKLDANKTLSFGDVFKAREKYYICITALCDCIHPKNNKFFFAEGDAIAKEDALKMGDTAFISYISKDEIVVWSDKTKDLYKPIYIKPISFTVPNYKLNANKIRFLQLNKIGDVESIDAEYKTTIKQNYAQRIANHAFSHPIRVGIDFVKK